MLETILVVLIVGIAVMLIGRSLYQRRFSNKNGCSCGSPCPIADKCESDIADMNRTKELMQ